ncbi:hypothetical protein [Bradyrhizobium yuanmingense]|uniref:hypothetical protein n=1 Tax=Bradyrhizobium yuanmingense TaxID=108015 RepID=UPI0004B544BF|nr:hypothetical protein [Bradyrhizobium yuanmingense]
MNCNLPKTITAGVTFRAAIQLPAQAAGWDALLYLRGPDSIDIEADVVGTTATFDVAPSETGPWSPGEYAWTIRATNGADVVEIGSGRTVIRPDLASLAAGAETRSENRIALDAIKAVLAKRATMDQERYRINNRELYRTPIKDLLALKEHYQQLVNDECCGGSKRGRIGSLRVGFGPTRG